MRYVFRFFIWSLLGIGFVSGVYGQQKDLMEDGKQAFREERYADAAQLFERVTQEQPENAEAYFLLSRVYFETPLRDTKKAGKLLDEALDLEPNNVEFLVGRLQQLRTESSNFFAEKIKESKRMELARQILKLDPENAFAHEEIGISFIHDFWRYRNAFMIPVMQYRQKDDLLPPGNSMQRLDNPYNIGVNDGSLLQASTGLDFGSASDPGRVFLADKFDVEKLKEQGIYMQDLSGRAQRAYEKAIDHLRKALEVDPRRRTVYDELMQIYSLKGEYGEAQQMLEEMYRFFPEDAGLWCYLGLTHYRLGNTEAAARSYETAFQYMEEDEQRAYHDLSYILPKDEKGKYEQDPTLYASRYWTSKDPRYLTTYNERLLEHYARLTYADLLYSAPDVDLRGWDTERGQILVRYGPPLADVMLMPRHNAVSFESQGLLVRSLQNPNGPIGSSEDDNTSSDPTNTDVNDTNQPGLMSAPQSPLLFEELNTFHIWEYGTFRFVFEDPFRNGEYRLYSPPATDISQGASAWVNDYTIRARETFREIPEKYEYEAPGRQVDLPFLTTVFKGEDGKADVYVHYGILIGDYEQDKDMIEITANTGTFLVSEDRDMLFEQRRTIYGLPTSQILNFEEARLWVNTQRMPSPPGNQEVSVEFETTTGGTVAVQRREVTVPDFTQDRLALSSLMPAYRVEETLDGKPLGANEVVRNNLSILPAPWSVFGADQPIYLYFEVYNLERDASGNTDYDVEILLVPKEQATGIKKFFKGILGGEKGVTLSYHSSGTRRDEGLYQIVDASDQEMGLYTLILRLRDNIAKKTVEEEQDLFLEK